MPSPRAGKPDAATTPKEADAVSRFETDLGELESIVGRIESGELPLEESLRLFERGTSLARQCRQALQTAELRVQNLLENPPDATDEAP